MRVRTIHICLPLCAITAKLALHSDAPIPGSPGRGRSSISGLFMGAHSPDVFSHIHTLWEFRTWHQSHVLRFGNRTIDTGTRKRLTAIVCVCLSNVRASRVRFFATSNVIGLKHFLSNLTEFPGNLVFELVILWEVERYIAAAVMYCLFESKWY